MLPILQYTGIGVLNHTPMFSHFLRRTDWAERRTYPFTLIDISTKKPGSVLQSEIWNILERYFYEENTNIFQPLWGKYTKGGTKRFSIFNCVKKCYEHVFNFGSTCQTFYWNSSCKSPLNLWRKTGCPGTLIDFNIII